MFNNTDNELQRYEEAELYSATATPDMFSDIKSQFNTVTGQTDLLAPLPSGGFVRLASQAPDIMVEAPAMPGMGADEALPVEGPIARAAEQTALETEPATAEMRPSLAGRTEVVKEVTKGLINGAIVQPANFLKENFGLYDPLAVQFVDPKTGEFDFKLHIMSREEKADLDAKMAAGELPYAMSLDDLVAPDKDASAVSGIAGGISQFLGAYLGIGKLFRVGSGFTGAMTQGAAADFLAFDGSDKAVTDMLLDMGWIEPNMITELLKKDPTDPDYVGRFQAAVEGAGLGAVIEKGLIPILGLAFRAIKDKDVPVDAARQAIQQGKLMMQGALLKAGQNAELRIKERGTGTMMMSGVDPTIVTDPLVAAAGRAVGGDLAQQTAAARAAYEASPNDMALRQRYIELRNQRDAEGAEYTSPNIVDTSYRMDHQPLGPNDGAAPLHDMTGGGTVFPDDIYGPEGLQYYGAADAASAESYAIIKSMRGNPDALVTIYRAVPNDDSIATINSGDFVALSKKYADIHAASGYGPDGQQPGKVIKQEVKASEIYSAGNDLNEFGYFPISQPYKINFDEVTDPALVPSARAASQSLSQAEQDVVTAVFPDNPDGAILEMGKIAKTKAAFPVKDGWSGNVELLSVGFKKNGNTDVKFKKVPYGFHTPPKDVDPVKWKQSIQRKTIREIRALTTRAAGGDEQALKILREASWYRDMRARMRLEFGGLGDVYADLLGTTSAQTGVEQNWDNAIEIMRRFSRGEFDEEIAMYEAKLAAGETNPVELGQAHNDPNNPFKLITKASGSLFNANSPSSTKALLDMFRVAKGAPKTPNFTGNLIGYTSAATVDVWAARFLNRMTGRPRLAPPTEQGVSGDHLAGSTLENPKVGAEFGFGQEVIQAVADNVNKSGILRAIDPSVGNVGADDLQAIMWFMEKEIWTRNGWTSKAGEGGSFDLEASYAGAADPDAVKAARKIASSTFKPPTPLKQKTGETDVEYQARLDAQLKGAQERFDAKTSQAATDLETATDPADIKKLTKVANAKFKPPAPAKRKPQETDAEYKVRSDLRFDEAKQKHDDAVAKASKELEGYKQPLARWVLGISIERPNKVPTNQQQAEAAARLGEPASADDAVVMYQINNSLGRFMGTNERNFNAEFVVRENFDPTAVLARMMEVAKETDQDAAFMSKVLAERSATSRPGGEIYFKKRKDAEFADLFSDKLTELGVDGFTYITDSRVMDQPGRQAQQNEDAIAGLTGIRFQYIPEFEMGADAWNALSDAQRTAKIDEMEDLYQDVIVAIQEQNPDISSATLMHYETTVGERGGYDQFRAPAN